MAASRLSVRVGTVLGACGCLLAVLFTSGCTLHRDYVRRGQLIDSLAVRVARMERDQARAREEVSVLRAEVSTQLEQTLDRLDQISARLEETSDRLGRIGLRLGLGRGNLTPQAAPADTAPKPKLSAAEPAPTTDRGAVAPIPQVSGPDPQKMYDAAYYDFTRGKYEVAISGFEDFIRQFPDSDNADNARYWIGECHYSMNDLAKAEVEFRRVLEEYPDGNKVPSAAYKLGVVNLAQGRRDEARRRFADVVAKYPGTNEARLAADKLQSMED